ncbi:hypothetical protein Hanom_Chr09g00856941 [Helianthus anomalus]
MEWSPEKRKPSMMNLVLGMSLGRGKSVGMGGRGVVVVCGEFRNKVVESRVRVLEWGDEDDDMFGVMH